MRLNYWISSQFKFTEKKNSEGGNWDGIHMDCEVEKKTAGLKPSRMDMDSNPMPGSFKKLPNKFQKCLKLNVHKNRTAIKCSFYSGLNLLIDWFCV